MTTLMKPALTKRLASVFLELLPRKFLSFFQRDFFVGALNRVFLVSALLINSIIWTLILIKIRAEAKPIPLHFNAYYGIELVGNGFLFLELPAIGLAIFLLNAYLAAKVYKVDKLLARMLLVGGLVGQAVLLLAAINVIIYINR